MKAKNMKAEGWNKKVFAGRVITVLAVAPFLLSSIMKFAGAPQILEGMDHMGWQKSMIFKLAILEMICAVLYLIPATSILGSVLLTGYIGGAIASHVRIGEPVFVQIIIGILLWLGIVLRESRLAEVLPIRAKGLMYPKSNSD